MKEERIQLWVDRVTCFGPELKKDGAFGDALTNLKSVGWDAARGLVEKCLKHQFGSGGTGHVFDAVLASEWLREELKTQDFAKNWVAKLGKYHQMERTMKTMESVFSEVVKCELKAIAWAEYMHMDRRMIWFLSKIQARRSFGQLNWEGLSAHGVSAQGVMMWEKGNMWDGSPTCEIFSGWDGDEADLREWSVQQKQALLWGGLRSSKENQEANAKKVAHLMLLLCRQGEFKETIETLGSFKTFVESRKGSGKNENDEKAIKEIQVLVSVVENTQLRCEVGTSMDATKRGRAL
jgi:hypothetical protein